MAVQVSGGSEARTARIAYVLVVAIFVILTVRLFDIQVVKHRRFERLALENQFRIKRVVAPRGVIRDRNGQSLADNVADYQLVVQPEGMRSDSLLKTLAHDFGVEIQAARARWETQRQRGRGHLPVRVLGNLSKSQLSKFEENHELYPGADLEARGRRRYIFGDFATHVLGYVGEVSQEQVERSSGTRAYRLGDVIGKSGVEAVCEDELRGTDGRRWVQVNAAGQELSELENKAESPEPGHDVYLTIDFDLQDAIENSFWPEERAGAAVVMDVESGALLAAVSKPGYDLNRFSVGISNTDYNELRNDPLTPLFNRYSMAGYPPGSTFKIVSSLSLLEYRVTRTNEVLGYACRGFYPVGNRIFRCHKPEGHGALAMRDGFEQSCDVYYYQLARALGVDRLGSTARRLGLGSRTGFELPESEGLIPDTDYYDRNLGKQGWTWAVAVNCIIGQGEVLVTPLQMARLVAAVANGGELMRPFIVQSVVDSRGRVLRAAEPQVERSDVIPKQRLDFLRRAMLGVVVGEKGTAKRALPESLFVAGKTGTAETPGKIEDHAWFVFFAPYEEPQIAGAIIVERAGHGGAVAAPLARQIVSRYFGIPDRGMAYWRRVPELRRRGFLPREPS